MGSRHVSDPSFFRCDPAPAVTRHRPTASALCPPHMTYSKPAPPLPLLPWLSVSLLSPNDCRCSGGPRLVWTRRCGGAVDPPRPHCRRPPHTTQHQCYDRLADGKAAGRPASFPSSSVEPSRRAWPSSHGPAEPVQMLEPGRGVLSRVLSPARDAGLERLRRRGLVPRRDEEVDGRPATPRVMRWDGERLGDSLVRQPILLLLLLP